MSIKYVLIFLKYQDEILLLNREKPTWMGCWNGVGGKINENETAIEAAVRETFEETNIKITDPICLAKVLWMIDNDQSTLGGMYCYIKEVNEKIKTPLKTVEGILDWKRISWILDPQNSGIAKNLKDILPAMLNGSYKTYISLYNKTFDDLIKVELLDDNH